MVNEKSKSSLNFISCKHQLKIYKNYKIYISVLLLVITYSTLFIFWDLLTQYDTAI